MLDHVDIYSGVAGPQTFGPGSGPRVEPRPNIGSGDALGEVISSNWIYVPQGYVSGTSLSAMDTYTGQSFSSLGLTPGTYTYTWSSDFLTVQIGPTSVPEPSAAILAGIGAVSVVAGVLVRKRREQRRPAAA